MRIFVINLDKNKERMMFMDTQLSRMGVQYERISAVCGATLSKAKRAQDFAAIRSFLATGFALRPGEIGCALSHIYVYDKMEQENIEVALVLEDDVRIDDRLIPILKHVTRKVDVRRPQVYILSAYGVAEKKNDGIERIEYAMCTDGYVITLKAAKLIKAHNYPVLTFADKWHRWVSRYGLELFRVWPPVIQQQQDRFISDISFRAKGFKTTLFYKVLWKFFRCFTWACDWILYKFEQK